MLLRAEHTLVVDELELPYRSGHLVLVPPHKGHGVAYGYEHQYERYIINFTRDAFEGVFGACTGGGDIIEWLNVFSTRAVSLNAREMSHMNESFGRLLALFGERANDPSGCELIFNFALLLLDARKLLSNADIDLLNKPRDLIVSSIMAYIEENFAGPLTLYDICENAHVSPGHASREFKAGTRMTVFEYVNYRRVYAAQNLIRNGCDITQAALNCGFNNIQHFYHTFKKITGHTPGNMR